MQVGPLGALVFWTIVILAAIALLAGITLGGMLTFVIGGAILVLVMYFILQRIIGRLGGV